MFLDLASSTDLIWLNERVCPPMWWRHGSEKKSSAAILDHGPN